MVNAYDRHDPALTRTAALMAEAGSEDEVIDVLRLTARWIAGSDGIAVVLREGTSCRYVAEDAIEPLWRGSRFPLDACISGWAMLNDEMVVITDIASDSRVPHASYVNKAICSLVMVPIGSPNPVAALGAYWCAMVWLDPAALARIEALARQAGEALARVRHGSQIEPVRAGRRRLTADAS